MSQMQQQSRTQSDPRLQSAKQQLQEIQRDLEFSSATTDYVDTTQPNQDQQWSTQEVVILRERAEQFIREFREKTDRLLTSQSKSRQSDSTREMARLTSVVRQIIEVVEQIQTSSGHSQ